MAKRPCVHRRDPKQLVFTLRRYTERARFVKVVAPRSARVLEAIYFK